MGGRAGRLCSHHIGLIQVHLLTGLGSSGAAVSKTTTGRGTRVNAQEGQTRWRSVIRPRFLVWRRPSDDMESSVTLKKVYYLQFARGGAPPHHAGHVAKHQTWSGGRRSRESSTRAWVVVSRGRNGPGPGRKSQQAQHWRVSVIAAGSGSPACPQLSGPRPG